MKTSFAFILLFLHYTSTSTTLAEQSLNATLLEKQQFVIVSGSKKIGTIEAPANSKVKVHETKEHEALVSFGGSQAIWLPISVLEIPSTAAATNHFKQPPASSADTSPTTPSTTQNKPDDKAKPDFFSFSAITKTRKTRSERGVYSDGINYGYSTLEISVYFNIFFTRGPTSPYSIEVFFIAQDKATRDLYVYDYVTKEYTEASVQGEVEALPLRRSGGKWIRFKGSAWSHELGRNVDATLTYRQPIAQCEFKGWIARVVQGGIPLKVEGNDGLLLDMAKKNPGFFTEIAKQE